MIRLSNGHSFEFVAASGALAFDGNGWPWEWPLRWIGLIEPLQFTIITKSLTLKPRRGHLRWYKPWGCVRFIKEGVVNAIGLTNPGIDWWIDTVYPKLLSTQRSVVVSLAGEEPEEYIAMAKKLRSLVFLKGIEINASCPNSQGELQKNVNVIIETVQSVKQAAGLPILLKLSCTHDYVSIAKALEGVVEAININSIPWGEQFPNQTSPLANFGGGGVSGKVAQEKNWGMVETLAKETKIPVIGPGVWEFEDIQKLFTLGAKAVAFGSVFLRAPWKPTAFVKRFSNTL